MRISSITFENFKNMNGTLELGERTLLFGPNGSGKTAALWAIGFVATGKSPLGGTNEASAQLFTGGEGSVTLHLDGGGSIKRELAGDSDGYSQAIHIDGRAVDKKRGELVIMQRLGDFAPMFSLRTFTDLSPEKRRAFVMSLIGGAECDTLSAKLDAATEHINSVVRDLRDTEAAARGIFDPAQARPAHVVASEVASLEGEIRDLREEIGKAEGQRDGARRALARCEWLRGQLAGMPADSGEGVGTEADSLDRAAAHLEKLAADTVIPDMETETIRLNALRAVFVTLEAVATVGRERWDKANELARARATNLAELRRRIAEAEASPWAKARELFDTAYSELPLEESDGPSLWDPLGYLISDQLRKTTPTGLPEAEAALADAEHARDAAKTAADQACEAVTAAIVQRDAAERAWTEASRWENTSRLQQQSLTQQALERRRQADTLRQRATAAAENRTLWQAELEALERGMRDAPGVDPADLRALLDGRMADLAAKRAEEHAAKTAEAAASARSKANARVDSLRTEKTALDASREEIRAERDLLLTERLERLTGPLATFLAAVRRGSDPRIDLYDGHGRPAFRVGWTEDGQRVTLNENYQSSGWQVFGAGLVYAMLQVTDTPFRCLLLDGGEIDSPNLTALMDGLTRLPGLDQIILTSHLGTAAVTAPEGWESRLMPLAVKREAVTA